MGCGASSAPPNQPNPKGQDPDASTPVVPLVNVDTLPASAPLKDLAAGVESREMDEKEKKKEKKDKKDRKSKKEKRDREDEEGKSGDKRKSQQVLDQIRNNPSVKPKEMKDGGFGRHTFIATNKEQLDVYYVVKKEKIGTGTYGSVRKGTNRATGAVRAVKTIPKKSLPDPTRFAAEIEILSILDHPNIIKLFETFEDARSIYLVMELCLGGELFDRIADSETGFSEQVAAKLVKQILSAVFYMHKNSIAHRDLKPENFLLLNNSDPGEAPLKVIDFGLSKQFKEGEIMTTKACTPYYVAPEVLTGAYTQQCDMWSLGVIIYVLLCGAPPFFGDTDFEVLRKVRKGIYDFDMPAWDYVSADAKDLIGKMLVLDPTKRYTAETALRHRWVEKLAPNSAHATLSTAAFANLKQFRAMNKLKKAALTVIAGQMTDDSITDLKEMFYSLDEDGDGTISVQEMKEGIARSKIEVPPDLQKIMEQVDSDGSGVIDYTEFLAATLDKRHYIQEDVCWAAFRVFDLDGNGKITKEELSTVLGSGAASNIEEALGVDKAEIERIIAEADQDGDGELDFDEFMDLMRSQAS